MINHIRMLPHTFRSRLRHIVATLLSMLVILAPLAYSTQLPQLIDQEVEALKQQAEIEKSIRELDDASAALLRSYRSDLRQAEILERYLEEIEILVDQQELQITKLEKQLGAISDYDRQALPLIREMLDTLEAFVKRDLPFQRDARLSRIDTLRNTLNDPALTIADKFQSVLSAYRDEHYYGYGLDVYQGLLKVNSEAQEQTVSFLRIGRLGLYYLSLDNQHAGRWDANTSAWHSLDSDQTYAIYQAVRVAKKQTAPDFLTLPMLAPTHDEVL